MPTLSVTKRFEILGQGQGTTTERFGLAVVDMGCL
jgi:hypothetical protein